MKIVTCQLEIVSKKKTWNIRIAFTNMKFDYIFTTWRRPLLVWNNTTYLNNTLKLLKKIIVALGVGWHALHKIVWVSSVSFVSIDFWRPKAKIKGSNLYIRRFFNWFFVPPDRWYGNLNFMKNLNDSLIRYAQSDFVIIFWRVELDSCFYQWQILDF